MTYHPIPAYQRKQLAVLRVRYRNERRRKYAEILALDADWNDTLRALEAAPPAEKQNVLAAMAQKLLAMGQPAPSPTSNYERENA